MQAQVIRGKETAEAIREEIRVQVEQLSSGGKVPGLAVILVGEDPGSAIYVRNKKKSTVECGMKSFGYELPADVAEADRHAVERQPLAAAQGEIALQVRRRHFRDRALAIVFEGMDAAVAAALTARGVGTREELAEQSVEDLEGIDDLDDARAGKLIMAARAHWFADGAASS